MRKSDSSTIVGFVVAVLVIGCQGGLPAYWAAVPSYEQASMPSMMAITSSGFMGGSYETYAGIINREVKLILGMVDDITANTEPVERGGRVEWRSVPGASQSLLWRLRVSSTCQTCLQPTALVGLDEPDRTWIWTLDVKPKMADDSAFVRLANGERVAPGGGVGPETTTGFVEFDWAQVEPLVKGTTHDRQGGDGWNMRGRAEFATTPDGAKGTGFVESRFTHPSTGIVVVTRSELAGFASRDQAGAGRARVESWNDDRLVVETRETAQWNPSLDSRTDATIVVSNEINATGLITRCYQKTALVWSWNSNNQFPAFGDEAQCEFDALRDQ